ncbi:MAG: hypothetical protein U1E27_13590, partial [Kiritimatiellia bacterium]|nr:hypothetical protein [Kiritimatiellia bacterium]
FEDFGLDFPEGSFVHYRAEISTVIMRNTRINHRRLGRAMALLGLRPNQIEVEASFVSFAAKELEAAARSDPGATVSSDKIKKMWTSGKGRLMAAGKIVTRSGNNAQLQGVREVIYPTDFQSAPMLRAGATNATDGSSAMVIPSDLETRQVGLILNVTPTLGLDGRTVDLTLVPELCSLEGWDSLRAPMTGGHDFQVSVPSFHSQNVTTSVVLEDGQTIVFGGMPDRAGGEWLYVFLTARVIDPQGKRPQDFEGYPLNPGDDQR